MFARHLARVGLASAWHLDGRHAGVALGGTPSEMADGTVAVAATPAPMPGRNMMWRDMMWRDMGMDAIRADPDFQGGQYTAEPHLWHSVLPVFAIMTGNARHLGDEAPTRDAAEAVDGKLVATSASVDADDYLATFESSWDYDPSGALDRITCPLLAINFADDLLNPAELGVTEVAMTHVKTGTSVLIPASPDTYGHQTLTHPRCGHRRSRVS